MNIPLGLLATQAQTDYVKSIQRRLHPVAVVDAEAPSGRDWDDELD